MNAPSNSSDQLSAPAEAFDVPDEPLDELEELDELLEPCPDELLDDELEEDELLDELDDEELEDDEELDELDDELPLLCRTNMLLRVPLSISAVTSMSRVPSPTSAVNVSLSNRASWPTDANKSSPVTAGVPSMVTSKMRAPGLV